MPNELQCRRLYIVALIVVLMVGVFLRLPPAAFWPGSPLHVLAQLHPTSKIEGVGFDEGMYSGYLSAIIDGGLASYPQITEHYIELQGRLQRSILPPSRFLYIFTGYVWHQLFGTKALLALQQVASCFSILTLLFSAFFALRLGGYAAALAVGVLMSVAPTQIHMSQHALIDGFFTFWALLCLWLLWENLRAPHDWRWVVGYGLALALLVTAKENSFFVWIALVALVLVNRWLQFGKVTGETLLVTFIGPLLGVILLIFLAGGMVNLFITYKSLVQKAPQFSYAILTGDGPWYRYLVDLFLVSPVVLILAFGSVFRLNRTKTPELYMAIFIAASYFVMCNVRYGMNLRYANMWDMPLRFLAVSLLMTLLAPLGRYRNFALGLAIGLLCAIEIRQYYILAVEYPLYELITRDLMHALHILK